MTKNFLLFLMSFCCGLYAKAQVPDDALRSAWFIPGGTARNIAIGGAMGSLGGDITANNINPAGIGLYKTKEIVLTPGFMLNNNKFNYRGESNNLKQNAFAYGATGIIIGTANPYRGGWTSSAFSISVNQLASFNNHTYYKGFNNMSSYSEQYLEELIRDGASPDAALSNYIFGSSLAFRTFLIDTTIVAGRLGYKSLVPISSGVIQEYNSTTKGGYHEAALGIAGNLEDKLYVGGSLVIPIVHYERDFFFKETDATSNTGNRFGYFNFHEMLNSNGIGIGAKLGMIYKPKEFWRIGFAIHTPQIIAFKDEIRATLSANTEGYAGTRTETSNNLNSGNPGTRQYNIIKPWRAIASASYVFREVSNTKKQRAFLSADIEYVNYKGARFTAANNSSDGLKNYYKMVNEEIKDYYKGNLNFRVGGELKFDPWMFRAGLAYYGSPYADDNLKASRFITSTGIGYRNYGFFIDLAYAQTISKDVNFPYRLNDVPNTYATQKGNTGTVVLTLGFKL